MLLKIMQEMFSRKKKSLRQILFINLLVFFILIVALELSARFFLYFTRGKSTVGLAERRLYLDYQPFVMFGPDFDSLLMVYRHPRIIDGVRAYRIVLLGGSTAANFPKGILEKCFSQRFPNRRFEVINLAMGGYNARQEVIVTSLWAPSLEPDMIISLDGANDLEHRLRMEQAGTFYLNKPYKVAIKKPFLCSFAHIIRSSQFIYGIHRLRNRMNIGPVEEYVDAIPIYISAQHSINVLSKGLSATRIIVLQPFMAFKEPLSEEESNFKYYKYREPVMKKLYSLLQEELAILAEEDDVLYVDARSIFNKIDKTIFSDDLHFVDDEGYRILAEYIVDSVPEGVLK